VSPPDNEARAPAARSLTRAPGVEEGRSWRRLRVCRRIRVRLWERRADPTKVELFLDGGGACFDAKTCAFTGLGTGGPENYDWSIYGEDPAQEGGIFNFARADNPFRDHSFIFLPACTGDAHLRDVTRKYSPRLTVEDDGFVNGTAALSYLAENYPDAAQVVYGGLASDRLPDAQVTVFGGQSGHIPDDPDLNAQIFGERWGAYANMPEWEVNEGLTARDWGAPRFWIQAGLHDPDIVLARFDYAYDQEAAGGAQVTRCGPVGPTRGDRRQRGCDRGGRSGPAQLHRARQRPRDLRMAEVLRDRGQRRKARRLGDHPDRGQTGRRRALPEVPRRLIGVRPQTQAPPPTGRVG
jgi:hypothetical protein